MRRFAVLASVTLSAAALAAPASAATGQTRITFEDVRAPCIFPKTHPLGEHYASLGVHFSGVGAPGGMVLKQCGGFGIRARSGIKFLAFNAAAGDTGVTERIRFDRLQSSVLLHAADGTKGEGTTTTFTLVGYRAGAEVGRAVVATTSSRWTPVQLGDGAGFDRVELTVDAPDDQTFVVDDLILTPAS